MEIRQSATMWIRFVFYPFDDTIRFNPSEMESRGSVDSVNEWKGGCETSV